MQVLYVMPREPDDPEDNHFRVEHHDAAWLTVKGRQLLEQSNA